MNGYNATVTRDEKDADAVVIGDQKLKMKSLKLTHEFHNGDGGAHASFRDMMLRAELLRAINESGFENPSEVQHECIPQAILGVDVLCQAKSGMGKTAVFVISVLQQLQPVQGEVSVLVMCHTRELAFQISKEFERFSRYIAKLRVGVFFGGMSRRRDEDILRNITPHIAVGTPGRLLDLVESRQLDLSRLKFFIADECDKMLGDEDMRTDVVRIFRQTPIKKQVMMFSATLPKDLRTMCKKFMRSPAEIFIDDESKLRLGNIQQYYVRLRECDKTTRLLLLLDAVEFTQVVIFTRTVGRCSALGRLLQEEGFPTTQIHRQMPQEERLAHYEHFRDFRTRILVSTDLFGRGMDISRVNVVINYDMAEETDTYLHRIARAGRFGTKGLAVTFVAEKTDADTLNRVQDRIDVTIAELPDKLDPHTYTEMK